MDNMSDHLPHGSQSSAGPGGTPSTGLESGNLYFTERQKGSIFLRVIETAEGSKLSLTDARPPTHLGKSQGDHITAYVAYLDLIMTLGDGMNTREVAEVVAKVSTALVPGLDDILDAIVKRGDEQLVRYPDRELRKNIYNAMKVYPQFNADERRKAKNAFIAARNTVYCRTIEAMVEACLISFNNNKMAVLAKAVKSVKEPGRAPGPVERYAIGRLRLLNRGFLDIPLHLDERDWVDDFYQRYVVGDATQATVLNRLWESHKGGTGWRDCIKRELEKSKQWDESKCLSPNNPQKLHADFLKHFDDHKAKKAGIEALLSDVRSTCSNELLASLFLDLLDFPYEKNRTDTLKSEDIGRILAFHLLVMFHSFKGIAEKCDRAEVVELFAEKARTLDRRGFAWSQVYGDSSKWLDLVKQAADFDDLVMSEVKQNRDSLESGSGDSVRQSLTPLADTFARGGDHSPPLQDKLSDRTSESDRKRNADGELKPGPST